MVARRLPMFPLETVLLPSAYIPLHVFEPRYRQMAKECLATDSLFGVVLIERGREVGGGDVRVRHGTTARIEESAELDDGRFVLVCRGEHRLEVVEWLPDDPYPQAIVEVFPGSEVVDAGQIEEAETSVRRAWALLSELGASSPPSLTTDTAADSSWFWCSAAPLSQLDRLALLRADGASARLRLVVELTDAVADDARRLLMEGDT